ncbi:MAG TPA: response regulator [Candidatus Binatia bacterium]|jgi:class 3 adenylate cyclase
MSNKILIVDDEPFNLDLLEQELMDYDYIIERAVNGVEALEKTNTFKPDVILLDYMMPKMNGLEVIKRLRKTENHKAIPVILLTAKASQEDKIAGLDAGADDYVTKPFDSFELLARVRAMLRIKQMHDTLEEWNRTLADKVNQQVAELQRMERLRRYLSPQITESILGNDADLFKTHRREITIVFLDLRGFTAFSDGAEPEEVMDFLRRYHAEMGRLVFKYEGTLERFMGDGIVVIFNDPIPCENHSQRAARMAIEMRDRVKELRVAWLKMGYDLDLGVGLVSGYATLGTVGFEGRMDYGTIGNLPNLAARLCAEAQGGQIVTDQKTMSKLEEYFEAESLEGLQLKGIKRPVMAFNLLNPK